MTKKNLKGWDKFLAVYKLEFLYHIVHLIEAEAKALRIPDEITYKYFDRAPLLSGMLWSKKEL